MNMKKTFSTTINIKEQADMENENKYQVELNDRERHLLGDCILLKMQSVVSWYGYKEPNADKELLDKLSEELEILFKKIMYPEKETENDEQREETSNA